MMTRTGFFRWFALAMALVPVVALGKDRFRSFDQVASYQDDAGREVGARFRHRPTGFVCDLVRIETALEAFIWVRTPPTSDRGEPHTQEHLLLGKGRAGQAAALTEMMSLAASSAFTMDERTCYHFHSIGSDETFYHVLKTKLNALLHPDYSDEEIRREVRNFGVVEDPATGRLDLQEQGTVYNEMVVSSANAWSRLYRTLNKLVYGEGHPLALSAGGWPPAIRKMTPRDIRSFHDAAYRLGNMGMVAVLPRRMETGGLLARLNEILKEVRRPGLVAPLSMPHPSPASPGAVRVVDFPDSNPEQPGLLALAWPAGVELQARDKLLLDLFLDVFAGDSSSNLYRIFIDPEGKTSGLDPQGVFAEAAETVGQPVFIGFWDVPSSRIAPGDLKAARRLVTQELTRVASLPEGNPGLIDLKRRVADRMRATTRELVRRLFSPPRFGFRGTGSFWMSHLRRLAREGGETRSLTMRPERDWIRSLLADPGNPFASLLRKKMLGVVPFAVGAKPDPEALKSLRRARRERIDHRIEELKRHYAVADNQEAVRRFRKDYDRASARIAKRLSGIDPPPFVAHPPLSLDPELPYRVEELDGVQMVAALFPAMPGAKVGLALSLAGLPEQDLPYAVLLPGLLARIGTASASERIASRDLEARLLREVESIDSRLTLDSATGRVELTLAAAGLDSAEAIVAVDWMRRLLLSPDLEPCNVARIAELVRREALRLHQTPKRAEESWVTDISEAFRRQDDPVYLAAGAFPTRAFMAFRVAWRLEDPFSGARLARSLGLLGQVGGGRKEVSALIGGVDQGDASLPRALGEEIDALGDEDRRLLHRMAGDLRLLLGDIPDETVAETFKRLCMVAAKDVAADPREALERMRAVHRKILSRGRARLWLSASPSVYGDLQASLAALVSLLDPSDPPALSRSTSPPVVASVLARGSGRPHFYGLRLDSMKGGVFLNSTPLASYGEPDQEHVRDYLASQLFAGYGPAGIFMKTWGAGLAYSNGFRGSPASGRLGYYAERTPQLDQTLRFVIDYLRHAPRDPRLVTQAAIQEFRRGREAAGYADRARAMARDLVDGVTVAKVRSFRLAILAALRDKGIATDLFSRLDSVYGRVLPGFDPAAKAVPGTFDFVLGPGDQLDSYERYLQTLDRGVRLFRVYPSDFWLLKASDFQSTDLREMKWLPGIERPKLFDGQGPSAPSAIHEDDERRDCPRVPQAKGDGPVAFADPSSRLYLAHDRP